MVKKMMVRSEDEEFRIILGKKMMLVNELVEDNENVGNVTK